ncbi:hypothetical protein LX15_003573 [Streptoalloteichus tenebrarius]|uniref:Uncharacterized protein n=1 Tax=Streptoalloteichus tenebrarius (strain ATCC 17920 / DSM 40477 / JCM 4838 / CBS 697.72 / NBRC 16177 / NCIMB 11028 / NRRL B-12390 / A12253. 1 / ISP 5477) TaxID=1933 RepID=A0ABT1HWI0_STRSD|nr:hypothetical protein [Streptoalloteichus tenebrarius]
MQVLVTELTPLVWHAVRGEGIGRDQAEDVVAKVWLSVWRRANRIRTPQQLVESLITLAVTESERVLRTPSSRPPSFSVSDRVTGVARGGNAAGDKGRLRQLARRWDTLRREIGRRNQVDPVPERLVAQLHASVVH